MAAITGNSHKVVAGKFNMLDVEGEASNFQSKRYRYWYGILPVVWYNTGLQEYSAHAHSYFP